MCGLLCNQPGLGELECKNCHQSICWYTAHTLPVVGVWVEGEGEAFLAKNYCDDWSANTVGD